MELITITCRENCFGISGYHGSCCRLENRHFIIGPISDPEEFLARVNKHYDSNFSFSDIFIEYEEGKDLFPDKINWQNPNAYPALRINLNTKDNSCIFYNSHLKLCSVYSIRPAICSSFLCDHLRGVLNANEQ